MFEAFKPHTKAVSKIAIDAKNTIIATGSDDQTIFFFSNSKNTRTPIGFVNLPSPVTYMTWTPADYVIIWNLNLKMFYLVHFLF